MRDLDALVPYLSIWLKQGLKHLKMYLEAPLANSYKSWYPEVRLLSAASISVQIDDRAALEKYGVIPNVRSIGVTGNRRRRGRRIFNS